MKDMYTTMIKIISTLLVNIWSIPIAQNICFPSYFKEIVFLMFKSTKLYLKH